MSEAIDSGINVTDALESSIDENSPVTCSRPAATPVSTDIKQSSSIPLSTNTLKEDQCNKANDNTETRRNLCSEFQERVYRLKTTSNLVAMIKIRSKIVLIGIIISMILLFQIPIILYYTDIPKDDLIIIPEVDLEACSGNPVNLSTVNLLKMCNITNTTDTQQDCFNSPAITGLHAVYTLAVILEENRCRNALQFFCDATHQLCGKDEDYNLTSTCLTVRDYNCSLEWRVIETLLNTPVPNCTSFEMNRNLTFAKAPLPDICPSGFRVFCNSICLPVCGQYAPFKRGNSNGYYTFLAIWISISFIGGAITLIVCYRNQHKLFHFPQIYIVYNTVAMEIYLLLLVISVISRAAGDLSLVCSSNNLLVDLIKPTSFCQIQGFILHLTFTCFMGFWCFHLFHLFLGLAYPYQAKHWMDSRATRMKFHIIEVVIVLIFGIVPPILVISLSNYQDIGLVCLPRSTDLLFHGETMPCCFVFCIGLSLMFYSLWILRKKHHLKSSNIAVSKIFFLHCTTSETKLYILFFYYGATMLFYLYTLVTLLLSIDDYSMYSRSYMMCSAGGFNEECEMFREKADNSFTATFVLSIFVSILLPFVNLSHLLYVVDVTKPIRVAQNYIVRFCK